MLLLAVNVAETYLPVKKLLLLVFHFLLNIVSI